MQKSKLKKWETAALIALCVTLLSGVWAQRTQARLSSKLVRLHVIAASDEDGEQALKLRVRDSVLEYLTPLLQDANERGGAIEIITANLTGIENAATSASEGRAISVTLGTEHYPTRDYASFSLPAGDYESLRITIGEGEGRNWWCVVFPQLCIGAATDLREAAAAVLDENEIALISEENEGYIIKFRLIELWDRLFSRQRVR
jgi:stage II sporulation protein R